MHSNVCVDAAANTTFLFHSVYNNTQHKWGSFRFNCYTYQNSKIWALLQTFASIAVSVFFHQNFCFFPQFALKFANEIMESIFKFMWHLNYVSLQLSYNWSIIAIQYFEQVTNIIYLYLIVQDIVKQRNGWSKATGGLAYTFISNTVNCHKMEYEQWMWRASVRMSERTQ